MILPPMSTLQEKSMRFEKARAGILPGISSTHPMKRFILECLSVGLFLLSHQIHYRMSH